MFGFPFNKQGISAQVCVIVKLQCFGSYTLPWFAEMACLLNAQALQLWNGAWLDHHKFPLVAQPLGIIGSLSICYGTTTGVIENP